MWDALVGLFSWVTGAGESAGWLGEYKWARPLVAIIAVLFWSLLVVLALHELL